LTRIIMASVSRWQPLHGSGTAWPQQLVSLASIATTTSQPHRHPRFDRFASHPGDRHSPLARNVLITQWHAGGRRRVIMTRWRHARMLIAAIFAFRGAAARRRKSRWSRARLKLSAVSAFRVCGAAGRRNERACCSPTGRSPHASPMGTARGNSWPAASAPLTLPRLASSSGSSHSSRRRRRQHAASEPVAAPTWVGGPHLRLVRREDGWRHPPSLREVLRPADLSPESTRSPESSPAARLGCGRMVSSAPHTC